MADPGRPARLASIAEARAAILATTRPLHGEEAVTPPFAACGRVLARDLIAARALPVFDHSAMDGYALAPALGNEEYRLTGRIAAGAAAGRALAPGEAVRIFTGAPIPHGAAAVAMQENVEVLGDTLRLTQPVVAGDNIRRAGEDVAVGDRLASAGARIDARHVGLSAALGLTSLVVRRKLRLALVSTGDELVEPGSGTLAPAQIFDCNRPMLMAALESPAIEMADCGVIGDDLATLVRFFEDAAARFDFVVTSGGASVGEEDHLSRALVSAGGEIHVARVAIRPGKPFTYGRIGAASVAILPGNPFAAFVAALLFVRPMFEAALGVPVADFAPGPARAGFAQPRAQARVEFVPARILERGADNIPVLDRLGRAGSARLQPLVGADGLAVIQPGPHHLHVCDAVGYLPFAAAFRL